MEIIVWQTGNFNVWRHNTSSALPNMVTSIRAGALLSDRNTHRLFFSPDAELELGVPGNVKGVCDTPMRGDLPADVMRNAEELLKNEDYSLLTSTL
jgi:hypothetical protein